MVMQDISHQLRTIQASLGLLEVEPCIGQLVDLGAEVYQVEAHGLGGFPFLVAQHRPVNVGAQFFACHQPVSRALHIWAAFSRYATFPGFPLTDKNGGDD